MWRYFIFPAQYYNLRKACTRFCVLPPRIEGLPQKLDSAHACFAVSLSTLSTWCNVARLPFPAACIQRSAANGSSSSFEDTHMLCPQVLRTFWSLCPQCIYWNCAVPGHCLTPMQTSHVNGPSFSSFLRVRQSFFISLEDRQSVEENSLCASDMNGSGVN